MGNASPVASSASRGLQDPAVHDEGQDRRHVAMPWIDGREAGLYDRSRPIAVGNGQTSSRRGRTDTLGENGGQRSRERTASFDRTSQDSSANSSLDGVHSPPSLDAFSLSPEASLTGGVGHDHRGHDRMIDRDGACSPTSQDSDFDQRSSDSSSVNWDDYGVSGAVHLRREQHGVAAPQPRRPPSFATEAATAASAAVVARLPGHYRVDGGGSQSRGEEQAKKLVSACKAQKDKELLLQGLRLKTVPDGVCQLGNHLEMCRMAHNTIKSLPVTLSFLTSLRTLDMRDNKIAELPNCIGLLEKLEELAMSDNRLEELPESLGKLKNLKTLDMYSNNLGSLPRNFGGMTALEDVNLGKNSLQSIPKSIGECTALRKLGLSSNRLIMMPQAIGRCNSLELLVLAKNQLVAVPRQIGELQNLSKLVLLQNALFEIDSAINGCTSLETLEVQNNRIHSLPELDGLESLKLLNVHGNCLTRLPDKLPMGLQQLAVGNNKLVEIPASIGGLQALQSLWLKNNRVRRLPPEIGGCANLRLLVIYGNKLVELPETLQGCAQLEHLACYANRLPPRKPSFLTRMGLLRTIEWIKPGKGTPWRRKRARSVDGAPQPPEMPPHEEAAGGRGGVSDARRAEPAAAAASSPAKPPTKDGDRARRHSAPLQFAERSMKSPIRSAMSRLARLLTSPSSGAGTGTTRRWSLTGGDRKRLVSPLPNEPETPMSPGSDSGSGDEGECDNDRKQDRRTRRSSAPDTSSPPRGAAAHRGTAKW